MIPATRPVASVGGTGSRFWKYAFKFVFATTPRRVMQALRTRVASVPIEELLVVGRRTGRELHLLVNLFEVDGKWYVGHPNGSSNWVRNLAAAGKAVVIRRTGAQTAVRAIELGAGAERDAVIEAATHIPPPMGLLHRLARGHLRAVGRYFRLEPIAYGSIRTD